MNETITPPDITVNPALMGGLWLFGLVCLVCWILEIVAAFKKEEKPLMGILSIVLCQLGGFIIGWIFSKKWGISKVMILWTISAIVASVLYGLMVASMTKEIMSMEGVEWEVTQPAPMPEMPDPMPTPEIPVDPTESTTEP